MRTNLEAALRRIAGLAAVAWLLGLCCGAAFGQQVQVTLDPSQTKINISVHDVHGGFQGDFKLKTGTVTFDPSTGNAGGEIIVDAASGTTGNEHRDSKMHREILETQRYPEITFLPRRIAGAVTPQGASNVQVQGVFHIHGADHDLTVSVPLQIRGDRVTGTTSFVVPYESWGIKNPSMLFLRVEGKAQVNVSLAGRINVAQQAAGGH